MTFMEYAMLRHGHPRYIVVAVITMIWSTYFFWQGELTFAIGTIVLGVVLAQLAAMGMNEQQFAKTTLGKILLLHLHPVNLLLQAAGYVVLMFGVWEHHATYMMVGASVILVGHMWGWHKVNEAF